MRVAFVTNRPAYYRVPIFRRLSESVTATFFFTAHGTGRWWTDLHEEETAGLDIWRGGNARQLYRALTRGEYDCVVSGLTGRAHLGAVTAAVAFGKLPLVIWVDMWDYPRSLVHALGRPLARHLLRRADAIVSGGSHVSGWIDSEANSTAEFFLMPNAVDNEHFSRPAEPSHVAAERGSFAIDADVIACFVGRLEPEKGLSVLLEALAATDDRLGLVIVGAGSNENAVKATVDSLGLGHRVRALGWVKQAKLPLVYQACDFLVMPSIATARFKEPWGLVANEAMNAGLPVVASDSVGAAAGGLVADGETGLVVPERDVAALVRAIERLTNEPTLRAALGARGRERVSEFTFDRCADAFLAAVRQACGVGDVHDMPQTDQRT